MPHTSKEIYRIPALNMCPFTHTHLTFRTSLVQEHKAHNIVRVKDECECL